MIRLSEGEVLVRRYHGYVELHYDASRLMIKADLLQFDLIKENIESALTRKLSDDDCRQLEGMLCKVPLYEALHFGTHFTTVKNLPREC